MKLLMTEEEEYIARARYLHEVYWISWRPSEWVVMIRGIIKLVRYDPTGALGSKVLRRFRKGARP